VAAPIVIEDLFNFERCATTSDVWRVICDVDHLGVSKLDPKIGQELFRDPQFPFSAIPRRKESDGLFPGHSHRNQVFVVSHLIAGTDAI